MFALLSQMLTILLGFVSRRVFVECLSKEYLGVSTAFTSILSVLSLAELGVGSAIIYSLYKPIATQDNEKIKSLMKLYRQVYIAVGTLILIVGAGLTPFLGSFVKEMPQIKGIQSIYLLLVVQNASQYFFSYKINFLSATQQGHIVQKFNIVTSVVQVSLQIAVLLIFKDYYSYLVIGVLCPFVKNIFASIKANRMYPFLREKAQKLEKSETKKISENVGAIFIYKICQRLSSTIDTVLISKMMGVIEVALYSNYHMIISYADMLFVNVFGAITPSIGNLMTKEDEQKKREFFSALQLIYYWVGTYLAVGLIVLFNPFIELWLGADYLFPQSIVIALVISITLTNFQRPCSLVRDSNGLFKYGKLRPLFMSIINVAAAVILVKLMGTIGVVLGTCIAKLTTFVWYDPYIVYKHTLKKGLMKYFVTYGLQWVLLAALAFMCNTLYQVLNIGGLLGFIIGFIGVTVIVNGVFLLINFKRKDFKYIVSLIIGLFKKKSGGKHEEDSNSDGGKDQ
jgi:O-antigen/teichoic acid export membrane protein